MDLNNGTKKKSYSCENCEENFIFKNDLLKHSKVHKLENFHKTCDKCEYESKGKDDLEKHVKTAHEVILYNCDQCDKTFSNTGDLEKHHKNDHKPKLFECDECDAKFKSRSDLSRHTRAHETNSFCHTFNNFPRCQYGKACFFLHIKAPFCNFDGRCSRPSCQYRHRFGCVEKNRFDSNNFMKRRMKDGKDKEKDDAKNGRNSEHSDLKTQQNKNLSGGI